MNQYAVHEIDANREIKPGTGVIMFRCQSQQDQATLRKVCERDRTKPCVIKWLDDHRFVIEPAAESAAVTVDPASKEKSILMGKKVEDLKTLAGERGVPWDKDVSRETMVERIIAAGKK